MLRVAAAHAELGADHAPTAQAAVAELRTMRTWLGLEGIEAAPAGNLSAALADAVSRIGSG